jgi:hypothetical protein
MLSMALSVADQEDIWKPAIAATWLMILTGSTTRTARLADTKTGASLRPPIVGSALAKATDRAFLAE